jgi:hypothetical protein
VGLAEVAAEPVVGSTLPRVFTPPQVAGARGECPCGCSLSRDTSYGFDVIDFARDVVGRPLDDWQAWLVVHAGELLPDGRPRFKKVLVVVARQNGKTELCVILSLFWLYIVGARELDEDGLPIGDPVLVLGTSTKLDYAKESWKKAVRLARRSPALKALLPNNRNKGVREANGEQELSVLPHPDALDDDANRYKIAPANEEGGRSLSLDLAILDELRQHHDNSAWDAIVPATNARPQAQVVAITNQGDDRSVVLNDLIATAEHYIATGEGDDRLGMFAWTAPPGSAPDDPLALAAANPNLGRRLELDTLLADARAAMRAGGKKLAGFKTEILCVRVPTLDPAIDPDGWLRCLDIGDIEGARGRIAMCLDVSLDAEHATLAAAAVLPDGRVRVEIVKAWAGPGCTVQVERELPAFLANLKVMRPRVVGWFPTGPAASLSVSMKKRRGWPPAGIKLAPISGETADVCMWFAAQVTHEVDEKPAPMIAHSADPLLNAHVALAEPQHSGSRWTYGRKSGGHVDALYAAAGAAHLARSLPAPAAAGRVVSVPTD